MLFVCSVEWKESNIEKMVLEKRKREVEMEFEIHTKSVRKSLNSMPKFGDRNGEEATP